MSHRSRIVIKEEERNLGICGEDATFQNWKSWGCNKMLIFKI